MATVLVSSYPWLLETSGFSGSQAGKAMGGWDGSFLHRLVQYLPAVKALMSLDRTWGLEHVTLVFLRCQWRSAEWPSARVQLRKLITIRWRFEQWQTGGRATRQVTTRKRVAVGGWKGKGSHVGRRKVRRKDMEGEKIFKIIISLFFSFFFLLPQIPVISHAPDLYHEPASVSTSKEAGSPKDQSFGVRLTLRCLTWNQLLQGLGIYSLSFALASFSHHTYGLSISPLSHPPWEGERACEHVPSERTVP